MGGLCLIVDNNEFNCLKLYQNDKKSNKKTIAKGGFPDNLNLK